MTAEVEVKREMYVCDNKTSTGSRQQSKILSETVCYTLLIDDFVFSNLITNAVNIGRKSF